MGPKAREGAKTMSLACVLAKCRPLHKQKGCGVGVGGIESSKLNEEIKGGGGGVGGAAFRYTSP